MNTVSNQLPRAELAHPPRVNECNRDITPTTNDRYGAGVGGMLDKDALDLDWAVRFRHSVL